jgi:hypothetical protein
MVFFIRKSDKVYCIKTIANKKTISQQVAAAEPANGAGSAELYVINQKKLIYEEKRFT